MSKKIIFVLTNEQALRRLYWTAMACTVAGLIIGPLVHPLAPLAFTLLVAGLVTMFFVGLVTVIDDIINIVTGNR